MLLHSFVPLRPEADAYLFVRAFDFLALSVTWIYFVNVQNVSAGSVYECTECAVYFAHVLCTPVVVCSLSTVLCSALLVYLQRATRPAEPASAAPPSDHVCHVDSPTASEAPDSPAAEKRRIEALFWEAKARAQAGAAAPGGARMRNTS